MNLAVLRRSRPKLEPGDIFAMRPPGGYLFGRVIDLHVNLFGIRSGILIYIYKQRSERIDVIPELSLDQLLVPPKITNRLPWTAGYFEHLEHRQLRPIDRLSQHCFQNSAGQYFDEAGNRMSEPTEHVGHWALSSFRTIDDDVSKALGIPLSPEDNTDDHRSEL